MKPLTAFATAIKAFFDDITKVTPTSEKLNNPIPNNWAIHRSQAKKRLDARRNGLYAKRR